jgi:hypothetical protein
MLRKSIVLTLILTISLFAVACNYPGYSNGAAGTNAYEACLPYRLSLVLILFQANPKEIVLQHSLLAFGPAVPRSTQRQPPWDFASSIKMYPFPFNWRSIVMGR